MTTLCCNDTNDNHCINKYFFSNKRKIQLDLPNTRDRKHDTPIAALTAR